jgi:hypothetical protein
MLGLEVPLPLVCSALNYCWTRTNGSSDTLIVDTGRCGISSHSLFVMFTAFTAETPGSALIRHMFQRALVVLRLIQWYAERLHFREVTKLSS